jgi:small subunit ribosomal protein S6
MRTYEQLFIIKPDAAEEEIDQFVGQLSQVITGGGGVIEKTEKWGVRRLAYQLLRHHEGFYVLLLFQSAPPVVKELERRMRVSDLVLKFLTVRVDEKMKRVQKRRKHREKRAARKPAAAAPVPQAPAMEEVMAKEAQESE